MKTENKDGAVLKYRIICSKLSLAPAPLADYVVEETKKYFSIEFDENNADKIPELFLEAVTNEDNRKYIQKSIHYGLGCISEKGNICLIKPEGIETLDQKKSIRKQKREALKLYKSVTASRNNVSRLLAARTSTCCDKSFSLSRFKHFKFICHESNYAFSYRFKKAKSNGQPLVVFLHGGGCLGKDNVKPIGEFFALKIWSKLKKHDCSVLIPQTPHSLRFGMLGHVPFLDTVKLLAEKLCAEHNIDKNRIYVLGVSYGGQGSWLSAYKYPDYYACAIPVSSWLNTVEEPDYSNLTNVPLWVVHAEDDFVSYINEDDISVEELRKLGSDVIYTRYKKGGHNIASRFFKNENWDEWMFSQSLEKRNTDKAVDGGIF